MSTHACFSNFRALLILNGYLYCAQMERAQNSDSETHVENLNQTSRTDLSRKSLSYIFFGTPCMWPTFEKDWLILSLKPGKMTDKYIQTICTFFHRQCPVCGSWEADSGVWANSLANFLSHLG